MTQTFFGDAEHPASVYVMAQAEVRREMQRSESRVTADEAGAIEHELLGIHDREERCPRCALAGRRLLRRLAERDSQIAGQGELPEGY